MYSESNHNKIERKPSEISRLRRSFLKKFNPVYRNQKQDDQTVPKGIYIRNVSKRAKSPFRKYELAAIEASVRSPIDKKRSVSASDLTLVGSNNSYFNTQTTLFKYRNLVHGTKSKKIQLNLL